jgi:phospholipid/cholesterol/gamma-HCH transport system substrate-binding protein
MSRPTTDWRDLKVGLIAAGLLTAIVLFVLLFARVGAMHGDTSSVYVLTDDAPGVLNGTEVWLAGKKIGQVKDIHFRPVSTDTLQRLAIHAQVYSSQLGYLRKDAYADIRPGGSLVGAPVIWISAGTARAGSLSSGDTLITKSTGAMKPVGEKIEALGARVNLLKDSGMRAARMLNEQMGSLGKIANSGFPRVAAAAGQIADLTRKARAGQGSLALLKNGDLRSHFARIAASKDSITQLMSTGNGNVARLRGDSTLFRTVSHLRAELDTLMKINGQTGTMSRMRSDSTLTREMAQMRAQLTALMADVKKHPTRYINF